MAALSFQIHVEAEEDACWICLEGAANNELLSPCGCASRYVHRHCAARWQLHSAGRE
jgi:E3 ubiquitin-protein ligase DOA10